MVTTIRNMVIIKSVLEEDTTLRGHVRRLVLVQGDHPMDELKKLAASAEGEFVIEAIVDQYSSSIVQYSTV
ncbi:hypothetical protein ADUPG1_004615, partial [Aduncisulcus paluster]